MTARPRAAFTHQELALQTRMHSLLISGRASKWARLLSLGVGYDCSMICLHRVRATWCLRAHGEAVRQRC